MKKLIYMLFMVPTILLAQAPVPFWSETFTDANGLPAGWSTADPSGNNALWTWCSNPSSDGAEPGCPLIWGGGANLQVPFQATTAQSGFVTLDSDEVGQISSDHVSQLTTPAINCAGKPQVYIKFQTHLGTYTYDADDKAILRVSTDQTNWVPFQIFNGLTTSVRWSLNPEYVIIDISSVAANQGAVYVQWEWTGNYEYFWNLDDVELFDQNPTPRHDLVISDYFYPASSYATPASELRTDTFGFYAFVSNLGLEAQTNVKLKAWIADDNGTVFYADSSYIDALPAGYRDSVVFINSLYVPDLAIGKYNIYYAVSADSSDLFPADNIAAGEFVASATQFAKEDAPEQYSRPNEINTQAAYYVANYYKTSKTSLEQYRALSADFAFTVDPDELDITQMSATLYLLRVNDDIDDELSNLDDSGFLNSFNWVGLGEFTATDTTEDDLSLRNVPLLDTNNGNDGVDLEEGARYVLAVLYSGANRFAYHGFNNDHNVYFTSTLIYNDGAFGDFGPDANATLRLNLGLVSTTDQVPLPEYALQVFPNPVTDQVNLSIKLDEAGPATITIADANGKVILSDDRTQVRQEQISYRLPQLASGIYLARIATTQGTSTKRFVVKK